MDLVIYEELAAILRPYELKGWKFRYCRSINPRYKAMVVLYYTIPNQPPRFERFDPRDDQLMAKISSLLAEVQILGHEAQGRAAAARAR